ncbi:hypothetical protein LTR94_037209, partial [Friedmanniomyces endolithicus]
KTAQTLVEQMSGLKEVVAPRISADLRRPEIVITPHMDLAASLGVTTQALSQSGNSAGTLMSVAVGEDGKINGTFSNGSVIPVAT